MKTEIREFVDAKTGEKVKQVEIPKFCKDEIEKALLTHQQNLNQFMMLSQNMAAIQKQWRETHDKIGETDKTVRDKMRFACKKLGLVEQDPWIFNLQNKHFELRQPPDVEPLTASQLQGAGSDQSPK